MKWEEEEEEEEEEKSKKSPFKKSFQLLAFGFAAAVAFCERRRGRVVGPPELSNVLPQLPKGGEGSPPPPHTENLSL